MPWLRLDDQFFHHRKVADLSKDAKLLHLAALTHCSAQLTDGLITAGALRIICGTVDVRAKVAEELVKAGLWEVAAENAHKIHDFLAYNPSANQVKKEREAAADRQATWRERHPENAAMRHAGNAPRNGVTPPLRNAPRNADPIPTPIPTPTPISGEIDHPVAAAQPQHARGDAHPPATTPAPTAHDTGGSSGSSSGSSEELPPAIRTACGKIARMARPQPLDVNALAHLLGPHRARDPAWLVAQAASARDWANEHHQPFTVRFIGNWIDRTARQEAAEANERAKAHQAQNGTQNGIGTNGTDQERAAHDQTEYAKLLERRRILLSVPDVAP